jgi:hypothetical protein
MNPFSIEKKPPVTGMLSGGSMFQWDVHINILK